MKYILCIIVSVLMTLLIFNFVGKKAEPLIINSVKTDTLWVSGKPDTVFRVQVKVKKDTLKLVDSVYVTSPLDPLHEEGKDIFISEKEYRRDYYENFVRAFAPCAVDSFQCRTIVKWDNYFIDKVYPLYTVEMKKKRKQGWLEGAAVTAGVGLLTLFLVK